MVAVQVRNQHGVNGIRIHPMSTHGDKPGGTAIKQDRLVGLFQRKAGVHPTAAAKSIATAEDAQGKGRWEWVRHGSFTPLLLFEAYHA